MELWIARDEIGTLGLFHKKPVRIDRGPGLGYVWTSGDYIGKIYKKLFPKVTFWKSPQKVRLELVKEDLVLEEGE